MFFFFSVDPNSRPLGLLEQLVCAVYSPYRMVKYVKFKVNHSKTISTAMIREALLRLKNRHTQLNLCIEDREGQLWFVPYRVYKEEDEVPYKEILSTNWASELENLATIEHRLCDDLLWKVTRLVNPKLSSASFREEMFIFEMDHVIMDGISAHHLIMEFKEFLCQVLQEGEEDHKGFQFLPDTLLPSLDEYVQSMNTLTFSQKLVINLVRLLPTFALKCLFRNILQYLARDSPKNRDVTDIFAKFQHHITDRSSKDSRTHIIPLDIPAVNVSNLLRQCRAHGTTIYGILSAASAQALDLTMKDCFQTSITSIESNPLGRLKTTLDLRRYFPDVPPSYLSMFISPIHQYIDVPVRDGEGFPIWKFAKESSDDIHHKVKQRTCLAVANVAVKFGKFLGMSPRTTFLFC